MINLTERAAQEVKRVMEEQGGSFLRVGCKGGGCSGFTYVLNIDTETNEKDNLEEQHGIKIAVDRLSSLYLDDVTIDFHEDLSKRGFVFDNPRATSCGCGQSFSAR